jgi:hypothetical protein
MAKEVVKPETILADDEGIHILTSVQRTGLYLAGGVGALIVLVTLGLLVFLWCDYPKLPADDKLFGTTDPKTLLDDYKALAEVTVTNTRELFQIIVAQALIPVFAAIIGYIFGKGGKS